MDWAHICLRNFFRTAACIVLRSLDTEADALVLPERLVVFEIPKGDGIDANESQIPVDAHHTTSFPLAFTRIGVSLDQDQDFKGSYFTHVCTG
ncbi:MAG: hypothetical protein WCS01_07695, partial [bacterium]